VIDVTAAGRSPGTGRGKLVGYPIVALAEPVDVIAYVRALEEALIRACAEAGVATTRVEGRSGVWLTGGRGPGSAHDRKVAAIGIRVARRVTMHGFALNCDCDLGCSTASCLRIRDAESPACPPRPAAPSPSPTCWA